MFIRRLRRFLREPYWLVLGGIIAVGVVSGIALARVETDTAWGVFGHAWPGDLDDTRGALGTLLGFEITVLTIVLSLNAPVIQSAANQYSPRLVPIYLKNAPLRRALPFFALSSSFILAAIRELGIIEDHGVRPRPVLSVAIFLVLVALCLLILFLVRTFRFLRVERVLGLVQDLIVAATERRIQARLKRLPLDPTVALRLPADATSLLAATSGYLADVDLQDLTRLARHWGVRVRVCITVGEYIDQTDVIGWVVADGGGAVEAHVLHELAATLSIQSAREPDCDPALGLRILVDVANRALSSSANDPYTARQALHQIRSVMRRLAGLPLGDWNVVDPDGRARVSLVAMRLRDYLFLAVDGPLHYAGGDPEVLEEVLQIALTVGLLARDAQDRAAAHALLARVLADVQGSTEKDRFHRLLAQAERVQASFQGERRTRVERGRADWLPD
ncbi:hypothetical protein COCOR_01784 [Corallococcus coralloides DSM 2259]|uniref:DUF2254 domain-containing protein n=1 Tax=Corallococcus coralloides (strain ATCC 25202 / DSM 2259 / NBRC 100086 / M2) TaxID=1144275 RepID=H8N1H6_CORCM|nr:DUF2254 domain-containing protein [Corallococcus coralloides]AFE04286.1 hypothetical protein COCOR_01784 [Corallococcus coralloides DSM 2259]